VATYDKQHLLPQFESGLQPGPAGATMLLSRGATTCGVEICKDLDFTQPARAYGAAGAGLLLVPAWDFAIDRRWHGHIAIMRGVENGCAIARSSREGNLTVSDQRGRIVAEARSDASAFTTLLATVPTTHQPTVYCRTGDAFSWLIPGVLAWIIFPLIRFRLAGTGSQTSLPT
jgi:apolipoprotein N-acyltransferase